MDEWRCQARLGVTQVGCAVADAPPSAAVKAKLWPSS